MADYFALILAAGGGTRMGADIPKQYLPLLDKPIIWHTINVMCTHARIKKVFVLLAPHDRYFNFYDWHQFGDKVVPVYSGGATRAETVHQGLIAIKDAVNPHDWIMVHDAVRPCLDHDSIDRLINEVVTDHGGVLAVPVVDTLKKSDREQNVIYTPSRENMWRAQTPQMFKYSVILDTHSKVDPATATDESSVVEKFGYNPKLVMGNEYNIKITYPKDLSVAENNLKQQK